MVESSHAQLHREVHASTSKPSVKEASPFKVKEHRISKIKMEAYSPEEIKKKKVNKITPPAFWKERAAFLPETAEYFQNCGVDPERVNPKPIGEGLTNVVFAYMSPEGTQKVIKVARQMRKGFMSTGYGQDAENIALVRKYFGSYAVPTEIHQDPKTGRYLIIQDAVQGKAITNKEESPAIRAQLVDLARLNREMMRQVGYSMDFIGVPGFLTWLRHQYRGLMTRSSTFELSNLLVDEQGKVKIIDEGLLRFRDVPIKQRLTTSMGFFANRLIMRLYFGVDLQPDIAVS